MRASDGAESLWCRPPRAARPDAPIKTRRALCGSWRIGATAALLACSGRLGVVVVVSGRALRAVDGGRRREGAGATAIALGWRHERARSGVSYFDHQLLSSLDHVRVLYYPSYSEWERAGGGPAPRKNPPGRRGVALGRDGRRGDVRPHFDVGDWRGHGHVGFVLR